MHLPPSIESAGPAWLAAGLGSALGLVFEHRRGWQDRYLSRSRRTARVTMSVVIATAVLAALGREPSLPSLLVTGVAVSVLHVSSSWGARLFSFAAAVWLFPAAAPDWVDGPSTMSNLRSAMATAETDFGMMVGALAAAIVATLLTLRRRTT